MLVRFLQPTDYAPQPTDSARCWGQLRYRATVEQVPRVEGDTLTMPACGPLRTYFRVGATPDLPSDIAMGFIAAGVAEPYTGDEITVLSHEQAMASMLQDAVK